MLPFRRWTLSPIICLLNNKSTHSKFKKNQYSFYLAKIFISALPWWLFFLTYYLNSFRRKPAISKLDWHFTPFHKSSQVIATTLGSFLHSVLSQFLTVHEKIAWFRVHLNLTSCLLQLVFTSPSFLNSSSLILNTYKSIIQKVRYHFP